MNRKKLHELAPALIAITCLITLIIFGGIIFLVDYEPPRTSNKIKIDINYRGIEREIR